MEKEDAIKDGARELAFLIQDHMTNAGLSRSQREKNVKAIEKVTASKLGGAREKSARL